MNNKDKNIENDLDDLKSLWKKQTIEDSYDKDQIFKMIHRKSINSVQWLFIISIIEFLLGIIMSISSMFTDYDYYPDETFQNVSTETFQKFENFSYFGILGSFIFISITYFYYRKISIQLSVSELIKSIIKFRRAVMFFIFGWLIFSITFITPALFELGHNSYIAMNAQNNLSENVVQETAQVVGWTVVAITLGCILIFCALYYGIIYGLFLRRLGKNLKELRKIA